MLRTSVCFSAVERVLSQDDNKYTIGTFVRVCEHLLREKRPFGSGDRKGVTCTPPNCIWVLINWLSATPLWNNIVYDTHNYRRRLCTPRVGQLTTLTVDELHGTMASPVAARCEVPFDVSPIPPRTIPCLQPIHSPTSVPGSCTMITCFQLGGGGGGRTQKVSIGARVWPCLCVLILMVHRLKQQRS